MTLRNPTGTPILFEGLCVTFLPSHFVEHAGGGSAQLTVKERTLLYLLDLMKHSDSFEVPPEMTQQGISRAAWFDLRHFSQYIRPLLDDGLVSERRSHVVGIRQRRKVYDLTERGKLKAVQMRERLKAETVQVRGGSGLRETTVGEVLEDARGRASILDILRQSLETGIVEPAAWGPPEAGFLEMVSEAPRVGRFIGRETELEELTRGEGKPRIFIVRGIAGIGKTWLATKACEILRGHQNILWHRVRPWDRPESILARLATFLAALGKPGLRSVLSRGEVGLARRVLRKDLATTESMLVFDDVHVASPEVLSLFGYLKEVIADSSGVRMLVLSRTRLPFYDRSDVVLKGRVAEIELAGLKTSEIQTFLGREVRSLPLLNVGRLLGGHPLLLELARAANRASSDPEYFRDARLFLEEQVYNELSGRERMAMKLASLYSVPVPRAALFVSPDVSQDLVLSLRDKSLLRDVGENRFEVHDTIREFFVGTLTPNERRRLSASAVDYLRSWAAELEESRDFQDRVKCLSNALEIAPPESRPELFEDVGDANLQLGDLPSAVVAYKEALTRAGEAEFVARLHRKTASALGRRGDVTPALEEAERGLAAVGGHISAEEGWLALLKARFLMDQGRGWQEARPLTESALTVFRKLEERRGQVEALVQLALFVVHSFHLNPEGEHEESSIAERLIQEASGISEELGDEGLSLEVRLMLVHYYTQHTAGEAHRAEEHIAAIERVGTTTKEPTVLLMALLLRGWYELEFRAECAVVNTLFQDAIALARKTHDVAALASATAGLALLSFFQGRIAECRTALWRWLHATHRLGVRNLIGVPGRLTTPDEAQWHIAECSLLLEDLAGFHGVERFFRESKPVLNFVNAVRAIGLLLAGHLTESLRLFEEAERYSERQWRVAPGSHLYAHVVYFYHGVVLLAVGHTREGAERISRARQILSDCGLKAHLAVLPEHERRLGEVFRKHLQGRAAP